MNFTTAEKVSNSSQPRYRPLPIEQVLDDQIAFFESFEPGRGCKRLVFVTDSGHSDQGFQLSMTIAKRCGLQLDLVQIIPEGSVRSRLTPEVVTLDAAGIPFTVTHRIGELHKEISRDVWERSDAAA